MRRALTLLAATGLAGLVALVGTRAKAEDAAVDRTEQAERCALRLSIAITGSSPDAKLMTAADPQANVDALLASPAFPDNFARFVNAKFNGAPAETPGADPVYWLGKYIVANDKPWRDLFVGPYALTATADGMEVTEDEDGVGYLRNDAWRKRYAGNEESGLMLTAAFRILQNTTGLDLVPSVGNPGEDRSGEGRQAAACKGCHFDSWFALDTTAKLLPKRRGQGETMTFAASTAGPQSLLGKTLNDERELATALVDSDAWRFNQCRIVFEFLYGRTENQCEAPIFDRCVDALQQQKTIRAAVAAVAKDPAFCQ